MAVLHNYVHGCCDDYVAKRSSGYLEVMNMEQLTSDIDSTPSANLSPGEIYSVLSLKDSIRYVLTTRRGKREIEFVI
jgi:hypothetical protein